MTDWSREDVSRLNGVGPKLKEKLEKLGIRNQQQLLFHLPLRYEDRTRISPVGGLQSGQRVLIEGEIILSSVSFGRRRTLQVKVTDGTGFITLRFFHFNANQQKSLQKGNWIRCFGEARRVMGNIEMVHPEYQLINEDAPPPLNTSLTPVYPTTEGLHQIGLRKIIKQVLGKLQQFPLVETLPVEWLDSHQFPTVSDALLTLHNPQHQQDVALIQSMQHPAQTRFVIEELTAHRISLLLRRDQISRLQCPKISPSEELIHKLKQHLAFTLTDAQQRVIDELLQDFELNKPMMRLVQGDVGSGKTVVAAFSALPVINSGYQCALMAPTEILAQQHYINFKMWLEPLGIQVVSLLGAHKGKLRVEKEAAIKSGYAQMVIGTHALFQQSVNFYALGLMIIDEQHRFGVDQRQALQKKAQAGLMPHQLIMTATPIPRTLAMSVYADLDYSQIDELPPGRTPVKTAIITESKRDELIQKVRSACADGQQIYWVCTLIEESEVMQCEAAEVTFEKLQQHLPDLNVGLVHGRMKSNQKDEVIQTFKAGDIQLLVATTVIEVGVDVPNASIMIIENPERLGLSQIHQLRGRVGRGNRESFCLLLVKSNISKAVSQRMEIIRNHQDGFIIAEKDLEIRGAGEVLGTKQTGEASFRIVDIVRDKHWFSQAEMLATILMRPDKNQLRKQLLDNWIGKKVQYSDVA